MEKPRTRALDAAITLAGTEGIRALTHGRIDAEAKLPKGSTSNYYRTRAALLAGVVDRIREREMAGVSAAFAMDTAGQLVEALGSLVEISTGPQRTLTAARLAVFLEARHDPEALAAAGRGRAAIAAVVRDAVRNLGAEHDDELAEALMACCEGLILHRITRGDTTDPRRALRAVLTGQFPEG